ANRRRGYRDPLGGRTDRSAPCVGTRHLAYGTGDLRLPRAREALRVPLPRALMTVSAHPRKVDVVSESTPTSPRDAQLDGLVSRLRVIEEQPLESRAVAYLAVHDELAHALESGAPESARS